MTVAIDGRACLRSEIGGVERYAREISERLVALAPDRYRLFAPHPALAHKAGHAWEQFVLPLAARRSSAIYCPANLAPVLSQRAVTVIHDTAALSRPDAYSRAYVAYQRAMLPAIARHSRWLITVSEFSKREIVERLGVAPEQVTVIAPGVDARFAAASVPASATSPSHAGATAPSPAGATAPSPASATAPSPAGATAPSPAGATAPSPASGAAPATATLPISPYALAVGTASARKNPALLARVATALASSGIELVLAGGARDYLRLDTAASDGIRRLGYVPDAQLPALYAGARMLVMPSLYEGFGLPCIEAMAAGVPVLAAAAGALAETCADAALLVDPEDGEGFAAAAVALVEDSGLAASLVAAGRLRAAHFSWDRAATATDALLRRLDQ